MVSVHIDYIMRAQAGLRGSGLPGHRMVKGSFYFCGECKGVILLFVKVESPLFYPPETLAPGVRQALPDPSSSVHASTITGRGSAPCRPAPAPGVCGWLPRYESGGPQRRREGTRGSSGHTPCAATNPSLRLDDRT